MSRWMVQKKEVELKGFVRAFQIPSGVVLDKIKAKFNEQESILTILMPKLAKGIRGGGIEEVNEEKVVDRDTDKEVGETSHVMEKMVDEEMSKNEISTNVLEKDNVVGGDTNYENAKEPKQGTTQITTKSVVEEEQKIGKSNETEAKEKVVVSYKEPKTEDSEEKAMDQEYDDVKSSEETEKDKGKAESQIAEDEATKEAYYKKPSTIRPNEETKQGRELVMPEVKKPLIESHAIKQQTQKPKVHESGDIGMDSNDSYKPDQIIEKMKSIDSLEKVENELLEDIEAITCSSKPESDGLPKQGLEECRNDTTVPREKERRKIENEVQETTKVGEEHADQDKKANVHESYQKEETREEKQKKPYSRKIMLCKPCVIAGSSIIVSLVVIAIHWIRSRKRENQ